MRSGKCINCKKYIGNTLKRLPKRAVDDGTNFYCNNKCYEEFKNKIGVREGKTFIEFKDNIFGWITRINLRRNPLDIEIIQKTKDTRRYVYLKANESELLLKKLKEFV